MEKPPSETVYKCTECCRFSYDHNQLKHAHTCRHEIYEPAPKRVKKSTQNTQTTHQLVS